MRSIVVTGANKGIGRAIVRAILAAHDDTFVFLGSRDAARGQAAVDGLLAEEPAWADRLELLVIDVSDGPSVIQAAAALVPRAPLYGLVNNAGIGSGELATVVAVNTKGPRVVCEAMLPLLADGGRIVNVSSASGPNFVSRCSPERQAALVDPDITREALDALVAECLDLDARGGSFEAAGLGGHNPYGLSKALLNAATQLLARENPGLHVNACTPGFIETDLTRAYATAAGRSPAEMGMKQPVDGTRSTLHLLFGELDGNGRYYGSDAVRSPLDRYRSPGDPPYTGD